jgi:hypothetical protein
VADSTPDPFADAERLVRAAREAAEQAAAGARAADPPPRGWETPRSEPASPAFPDLSALFALVETLKGSVPPELVQQLTDALRDLLLALRAVLDYSIARLEPPAAEPVQVEDIPVE